MAVMILDLIIFALVLIAIFGILCTVTGEKDKGNQVIVSCMSAIVLLVLVITMFQVEGLSSGVFESGIPLIGNVQKAGSIKEFIVQSPGQFALDFVELVTVMLLINWVSNIYKASEAGFAGKILTRIIIVCIAVLAYGLVMDIVRENIMMKWAVYGVECIVTGTGILYTPAMIFAYITGWKKGNPAIAYAVSQFPKTNIGKAISTAISTSVILIVFLVILETQYGGMKHIVGSIFDSAKGIMSCVIVLMGIYFMIMSFKKKK